MSDIETYNSRIAFWEKKLKNSRNQAERAELTDKIAVAKKEIEKLQMKKSNPEINGIIDAPAVIDRKDNAQSLSLTRGQIALGSDNKFRVTL